LVAIYVTSIKKGAGKTMVCAGLGRQLQKDGKKVGFFKPVLAAGNQPPAGNDSDALFMKNILGLKESAEVLCPAFGKESNLAERLRQAFALVARDRDVMLIEGLPYGESEKIIAALDARVLIIEEYPGRPAPETYKKSGNNLLGVIINKVPASRLARVSSEWSSSLGKAGINLLGVIPEDRGLAAITVAELARSLGGTVLNAQERSNELVESVMIGAMAVDSGLDYFGRRSNKAVLVRGERPDMQIAALQTSTRCLVIGGGAEPIPAVRQQAENKHVPLITVKGSTSDSAAALEEAVSGAKFNQEKKLARLDEIMGKQFSFPALYKALGWAK
jgi:uncharacterized protein